MLETQAWNTTNTEGLESSVERVRRVHLRRIPWSRLLVPGELFEVPRAEGSALRLTAAQLPEYDGSVSASGDAEVCVAVPKACGGSTLTLARLGAGSCGVSAATSVKLRALLNCAEGAVLSANGGPVLIHGRLEGTLPPEWLVSTPPTAATPVARPLPQSTATALPGSAPQRRSAQVPPRPRSEGEYIDWLEEYLRREGRTSLRKLGDVVQRPSSCRARNLKAKLLRHRSRFVVDLQDCADVNRAGRWSWRSQAISGRRRGVTHDDLGGWA